MMEKVAFRCLLYMYCLFFFWGGVLILITDFAKRQRLAIFTPKVRFLPQQVREGYTGAYSLLCCAFLFHLVSLLVLLIVQNPLVVIHGP